MAFLNSSCGLPVRSVEYLYIHRRFYITLHPVEIILYTLPWKRKTIGYK